MPAPKLNSLFETRSHAWSEAGLERELTARTARRARREAAVLLPLLGAVLAVFAERQAIVGTHDSDAPVRIGTVIALVVLGWWIARDVGRIAGPVLLRRMDPATAGTAGFLIRLAAIVIVIVAALRIAQVGPTTIAVGGGFTAVVLGLAAQQTLGNLFAGMVLLSARPFRVGERVRLHGGSVGGQLEGVVSSLGLLYTTFRDGEDRVMVPNSVVINVAVSPLREPDSVSLRVRLPATATPADVEQRIVEGLTTPIRGRPRVTLEELDGDELVVQVEATPVRAGDGSALATELLAAVVPQAAA